MKGDYHENKKWNLSREGAQLLRFITTYHSLQYEQVLRLFSKNRESIKSLITSLVKQKRIIYDKENGLLCDSQESANNPDYGMIASFGCFWTSKQPLCTILTVNFL